jgi:hypothetical protein
MDNSCFTGATRPISEERRRSQRTPLSLLLFISSLDPDLAFLERCQTVEVNHHGCSFSAPQPFKHGTRLRLGILHNGQVTTARVVYALPLEPALKRWRIGLELDKPGHVFWAVPSPPHNSGPTE